MSRYSSRYAATAHDGVIVDLSRFASRLVNYDDISADLSDEEECKLVDYVKAMLDMSHARIRRRYDHWQLADRAHDVWVPPDATRFKEKAVIADTRAIADTVLTYVMAAITGRNPMFQLEGQNRKSRRGAMILERVLHQQMRRTGSEARLAQQVLDTIRYGFAPTKVVWNAQSNQNNIVNADPRRTFPDPRVNWGDWENMQFIVFTDFQSYDAISRTGLYPKLKKFPELRYRKDSPKTGWDAHKFHREEGRGLSIDPTLANERSNSQVANFTLGDARSIDEAWFTLAGEQIGIPGIEQVWLVCTVIDESVVIRFQLNPYGRQFPAVIGGLFFDSHKTYSQSLYDLLLPMHDIATWLLRSRIDNVQAALNNLIFADPTMVSIPDLVDRNPWGVVRTLPGAKPGEGFFIAQVPDVTKGHWNDIAALSDLKQRVAAAGDAQQGMPTTDVRTATEIARLTQLGSQRLGVLSRVLSATTVRPMVRMMVQNIQDALAFEGSVRVDPNNMPSSLASLVEDGYIDFDVTKDLQGDIDYLVIDGTLPLEPTRNAETWLNMLQVMQQTGLIMEYKAGLIAEEAIRSMGVTDLDRFRISPEERQNGPTPSQEMAMMERMRGANVVNEENLQREIERGNLIPMRARSAA